MHNVLLTLSYDGTNFCGWQTQKACESQKEGVRTVQEEIEKVLSVIHKEPTAVQGSGRTDSGVHATGQTANFFSPIDSMKAENYVPAMNSLLTKDVRVIDACEADENFNARFCAVSRTYRYFINCRKTPFAHEMNYCYPIRRIPDVNKLNEMASCLKGELDCSTFAASGDKSESKKRFLYGANFFWENGEENNVLIFEITANAFLWKMVRSITGTLLEFEEKGMETDSFEKALLSHDRSKAGITAPPQGLFLWNVSYDGKRVHP